MPGPDLELLTRAAREAGDIARGYFGCRNRVWEKAANDPVSEADLAVDQYLREALLAARPDYGWLSEETEDAPERRDRERIFVVDPIDGTRAFIAGERTWALSLAVVAKGRPEAGVVYLPMKDRLYSAERGRGGRLNGARIAVSSRPGGRGARILAARPALDDHNWPGGPPPVDRHFRPSLAYRLCLVAEGRFDAMLTLRDSWEWDLAAGALIASESGAAVTDRTGHPLVLNKPHPVSQGVLAATPGVHADLLGRLAVPAP